MDGYSTIHGHCCIRLRPSESMLPHSAEVELSPKGFAILRYLMEHPGWIISRDTLLDRVWGEDGFVIDRAVDNHIKRLRKALGSAGGQIHTVIGRGYKLMEK